LPNQARISPSWKQEVNERIAAHKNRKPSQVSEPEAAGHAHSKANQRAAAAAARVAARFAKAPSYSQTMAEEARAAVRAAEAVSRAALEAQAAAESVLAELEAAHQAEAHWDIHNSDNSISIVEAPSDTYDEASLLQHGSGRNEIECTGSDQQGLEVRWDSDLKLRQSAPAETREWRGAEITDQAAEDWREPARDWPGAGSVEVVEPAQPIHANLIEFPREIIATRKVRPRRVEGPYAAMSEQGAQLSIFEVDPGAISIDPEVSVAGEVASSSTWVGPEWSGMELGAQPETEYVNDYREVLREEARPQPYRYDVSERAPLTLRLMAVVVDFALMLGSLVAAALVAGHNAKELPSLHATEFGSITGLLVVSVCYLVLFYALANGTPGMKYAGIELCTFDGREPARQQRLKRIAALLLSVLPVGVGVLWAIFDDDHLSWHDRLSETYLRRK
jgi:uncharacterized RDD family membrane protein YckC